MRLTFVFVPLGISLAVAGGIMIFATSNAPVEAKPYIVGEVRHEVTAKMLEEAGNMAAKPAPHFELKDIHGKDVHLGGAGAKAQFVYFVLDGCPCSMDAQPLFNGLYARFRDRVDFIAVINVGKEKALSYAGEKLVLHPMVCDEEKKVVNAYGAKQSVYNVIIRPDGSIEKMYPGYSADVLKDINRRLSRLSGVKEADFDTKWAPKQMASGCYF